MSRFRIATQPLRALWLGTLTAGLLSTGCSLILDPENCTGNAECQGGVCTSGICVGAIVGEDAGDTDDRGPGDDADVVVPDAVVADADLGHDDLGPDVTVDAAEPSRPTCTVVAPIATARTVNTATLAVQVRVSDGDDAPGSLTVTVGTAEAPVSVDLMADGTGTAELAVVAGTNRFTLRAVDPGGLDCSAAFTVEGDFTAPTLAITRPLGARTAVRTQPFQIEGNATDRQPVRILEVTVAGARVAAAPVWQDTRFTLPIALTEGANAVSVVAVDLAGNRSAPADFTVEYDPTAPTIRLLEPANGAQTASVTADIRGEVLDGEIPDPLAEVTVTLTGPRAGEREQRRNVPVDESGIFLLPDTTLFQGANLIEACARDQAGNNACVTATITREDALPCVNLDTPRPNSFVGARQVLVTGSVCPVVNGLTITVGAQAPAVVPIVEGRFEAEVTLPAVGAFNIVARATTADGQSAQANANVTVDETPPTLRLTRPVNRDCLNGTTGEVCGTVTDIQSGVSQIRLGATVVNDPDEIFCVPLAGVADGLSRDLQVVATNAAGLTAEVVVNVDVDSVAPELTLDVAEGWIRPDATGRASVSGTVSVGVCGLAGNTVQVTVNGTTQATGLDAQGVFRNARVLVDGSYPGTVVARDRAGNATTRNFTLRVDATPPLVDDLRPPVPRLVDGAIAQVSARVSDGAGSGIVFSSINGTEVQPNLGRIRRDLPVGDGATDVVFVVRDAAGNETRQTITIYRDVEAPVVTVTSPAPGTAVPTPLIVTGTVDDGPTGAGVATVTVNGVMAVVNADGTWRAVAVPVSPANPTLTVVATDLEGNANDPALEVPVVVRDFALLDPTVNGLGGASGIGRIVVADLNADGRLDIVALSDQAEGVSAVFLQGVGGGFTGRSAAQSGLPAGALQGAHVADFNADGRPDLLVWSADRLDVLPGNGAGGFGAAVDNLSDDLAPSDVVVGDINRDGLLDVLILADEDTRCYLGSGGGGFQRELLDIVSLTGVETAEKGVFADFNADGLVDLVTAGPAGMRYWAGNTATPYFSAPVAVPNGLANANRLVAFDANRDANLDLLAIAGPTARVFTGSRGPNLASSDRTPPWSADGAAFAFGDLDNDTRDDGVVAGTAGLGVFRAQADGNFELIDPPPSGLPDLGAVRAVDVLDLDGDGDLDVIAAGATGVAVIRSNRRITTDYRFIVLDVRRTLAGNAGPTDAIGAVIYQNVEGTAAPERALPARPSGPTVVTLGAGRLDTSVEVRYIDRGNRGRYIVEVGTVSNGVSRTVNDQND